MEEPEQHPVGSLFERAEDYTKTTLELIKLKMIDSSADFISSVLARLVIAVLLVLTLIVLNIGVGFWLGDMLGKVYYGFFALAGFYVLLCILFYAFRKALLKIPISNALIRHLLKRYES